MEKIPQLKATEVADEETRVSKIKELLDKSAVEVDSIDKIDKVRIGTYQVVTKDTEGNAHIHDLDVANLTYIPKDDIGGEKRLLNTAAPVKITPSRAKSHLRKDKVDVVFGDAQVAYRHTNKGYEPTHDPYAMDIVAQVTKDVQPDRIIIMGDMLDLPLVSRWEADSNQFVDTMQMSLDGLRRWLAQLRADNPNSEIVHLEGNHEIRLRNYMLKNAPALFGLKRKEADRYPMLSFPDMMGLEELDIEYRSGYPANRYRINDRLAAIHGKEASRSTAMKYAYDEDESVIFGHVHRIESFTRTSKMGRYVTAATFGALCDITGSVPSCDNGITDDNEIARHYENWQNGMGIIQYKDGDKPFEIKPIYIDPNDNYITPSNGREYKPRVNHIKKLELDAVHE